MRDLLNLSPDVLNKEENRRGYLYDLAVTAGHIESFANTFTVLRLADMMQRSQATAERANNPEWVRCGALGRYHAYQDRVSKLTGLKPPTDS